MFTMKILLFLLLLLLFAGCAVKCDNTSKNYYIVEMPSDIEDQTLRDTKKPYNVYWNVPTIQCKSKKIPFENLHEKYGIIQNSDDKFLGERIAILYDPGLFPALLTNEPSGKLKFRNGGVPQEGDLEKHLVSFRNAIDQSVPDPEFNGVGIIDFESWRPVFRQNFGVLSPYQDVSIEIERAKHWWWSKEWIKEEARLRFEEAARSFMQSSLSLARQMRPGAVWGYYGFPYCFNMATNNMAEECARVVPKENDHLSWLWADSTALFPSVYSSKSLSGPQLAALVRGRVREALRLRRDRAPVLPYFWYRYREGGFFTEEDLNISLKALYNTNSSGFIIWGSSKDVNTVEKCKKLYKYVDKVLGPAVAKYTKHRKVLETSIIPYMANDTVLVFESYTTVASTVTNEDSNKTMELDPEFHWTPPENYTQDIKEYVNDFMKITTEVTTKNPFDGAIDNALNINNTNLIDIIMGTEISDTELYRNDNITSQDEIIKDENVEEVIPACLMATKSNIATVKPKESAVKQDLNTDGSETITERVSKLDVDLSMQETSTVVHIDVTKIDEKYESTITTEGYFPFNEENLFDSAQITSIESSTNVNIENDEVNITDDKFTRVKSEISETTVGDGTDLTTSTIRHNSIEDNTINLSDVPEITKRPMTIGNLAEILDSEIGMTNNTLEEEDTTVLNVDGDRRRDLEPVTSPISSELSSAIASFDKAVSSRSSANTVTERRYIMCVFLHFYSVSKCLCEVYGQCEV